MGLLHLSIPFRPRSERVGSTVGETSGRTYPGEIAGRIEWTKCLGEVRARWGMLEEEGWPYAKRMNAVHCLRAETEPDNVCCSHRCTSTVRPGQGRVRCD